MTAPSFSEEHPSPDTWLMVCSDYESDAHALGLRDPETIEAWIERGVGAPHSMGRARTHTAPLPSGRESLLLRRVLHGGALGPLWRGRIAGVARPRAELRATAALRAAGAPVPRPVLAIARRRGALWQAALATVFEEDAVDGLAFFAARPKTERVRCAARAVGEAVRRFHDAGGRHRDLHLGNLLLRARGDENDDAQHELEALVIDLDRARVGGPPDATDRAAELARLARSLRKHGLMAECDSSVRAAFCSAYCGDDAALREALQARRRSWHLR